MIEKIKRGFFVLLSLVISLISGGIIFYFWKPIASWYFNYRPILGVDFYNFASYVAFFQRHFVWPFNGWKYIWWSGGPIYYDYPTLHMYLTLPLLSYFSIPQAIQVYMLGATFLFLFFSYLLFYELAKERVLPLVLTIAASSSIGLYGALVWGGSLPYFATQLFLPLVLWMLVRFFKYESKKSLLLAGLFMGISFFGHPQVAVSYILPITILWFLFFSVKAGKKLIFPRLKVPLTFFGTIFLIGLPSLYLFVGITPLDILRTVPNTIGILLGYVIQDPSATMGVAPGVSISETAIRNIANFNKDQLLRFWNDTNPLFFYLLAASIFIFLVSFVLRRKKAMSLDNLFYLLPLAWVVFYISLYGFSISFMHGGWYRVFWPFPLVLGIFISSIWGDFWDVISERLKDLKWRFMATLAMKSVFGVLIFLGGFVILSRESAEQMLKNIDRPGYRQQSSAFPDSLSVEIDQEKFEGLKVKLIPSWLNPNDTQYRFYDADQRVNIWWNTLYDMPLVKGYIEFPPGDSVMGSYYWLSAGLTSNNDKDVLVEQWGVPKETAYNNVLFLLDWFSIKYLEAEHDKTDSYNPLTSYIRNSDIFSEKEKVVVPGWAELYMDPLNMNIGPIAWHPGTEEFLSYYKIKDELVTPIIYPSNALTLGIIGRPDAYSTIIRNLGALNLNSRHVIPIRLGQFIDDVSGEDLKAMDALFLYTYDYKNYGNSWGKIEKYIKEGGKVFIETGSDVKQTAGNTTSPLFPFEKTKKKQMSSKWSLSGNTPETEGIDLGKFGPPILDNKPWFFSVPESDGLKEGASVILANERIPIVVSQSYGKGEVIWSGMNLPYHLSTHKSLEELKFFKNILDQLVKTNTTESPEFSTERISPTKVEIKSQNAKGVLFKENMSPGWEAKLSSNVNKNLKIYKTGIIYNGYAYVRLPEGVKDSFTVTFSYRGFFWSYFWSAISFLTSLLILDKAILGGRFLYPLLVKLLRPLRKKTAKVLEKDEDY